MSISFTVPGPPQGKQRPKFSGRHAYTPDATRAYEDKIGWACAVQCRGNVFPPDSPLRIEVGAYFSPPKAAKGNRLAEMLDGIRRPVKRPDLDNIVKAVLDACNGVAYKDDCQIVEITARKWYSDVPRVEVKIEEVAPGVPELDNSEISPSIRQRGRPGKN